MWYEPLVVAKGQFQTSLVTWIQKAVDQTWIVRDIIDTEETLENGNSI